MSPDDFKDATGWFSPSKKPGGRPALIYPFPLGNGFLAEISVPRDLRKGEAERLCAFIKTLATPEGDGK